jgi:O-6-methylguanine DNA methyltransferase
MRAGRYAVKPIYAHLFATPLGNVAAALDADGRLFHLEFTDQTTTEAALGSIASAGETVIASAASCAAIEEQLGQYFRGERRAFTVPLALRGTEFQRQVWALLLSIPHGETTTYGELAARLGNPNAARAVGRANATNRIAIVVPCHRVIGANASLTGYAFGLARKQRLLALEEAIPANRNRIHTAGIVYAEAAAGP